MTCQAIICDWNGTLIDQPDEKPAFRQIAVDLFLKSIPFRPFRMARLLRIGGELEALYHEKRQDENADFILEMFKLYNERVIKGLPVYFIQRSVRKHARKKQTLGKLDHRVLRPVAQRHSAGVATGILSAGYDYGIRAILEAAGYGATFDSVQANQIRESGGRAVAFELNIYKNKHQFLLNLLRARNLNAGKVVYMGDSDDDTGCFELVGYPVVAFLTSDELKQRYAEKYRAFVPSDEADLTRYLNSI